MTAHAAYDNACAIVYAKRQVRLECLTAESYNVREVAQPYRLVGQAFAVGDGGFRFYSLIGVGYDVNDAEPTARAVVERAGFVVEGTT